MKKVKTVTTYSYSNDDTDFKDGYISGYIKYDENENVLEAAEYSDENELESKTVTKYDSNGLKTEETNYTVGEELSEHITYKRNEHGELMQEIVKYQAGMLVKKHERNKKEKTLTILTLDEGEYLEEKDFLRFNDKGHEIEKKRYDSNERLIELIKSEYNSADQLSRQWEFDEKGNLKVERQYKYDDKGLLLQQLVVNKKGELVDFLRFKYDENGQILEQQIGKMYAIRYEYDIEKRTRTQRTFDAQNNLEQEIVAKFDEEGNLEEEKSSTVTIKYVYEYFD